MGCDTQFDSYYDNRVQREEDLRSQNESLRAQLAAAQLRIDKKDPDSRGYDVDGKYVICRFDRTVTDSMDAHDRVCTNPSKKG